MSNHSTNDLKYCWHWELNEDFISDTSTGLEHNFGDSGILAYSGTQSQFCVLYSTPCNDLKLGFPITDHQQQPPELFEICKEKLIRTEFTS